MQIFLAILIALWVAACAWWLVTNMLQFRIPAEPADACDFPEAYLPRTL